MLLSSGGSSKNEVFKMLYFTFKRRKLFYYKYKNINFYFLDNAAEADEEDPKLTADQTQAATNADDEFETVQDSGEKQVS